MDFRPHPFLVVLHSDFDRLNPRDRLRAGVKITVQKVLGSSPPMAEPRLPGSGGAVLSIRPPPDLSWAWPKAERAS